MEALMVERVESSLARFMHRNAVFLCERLAAQFPSPRNLQLLAKCYLRNNQAYAAYHVLKGEDSSELRYIFAVSCFQLNFLREAEAALCSSDEPSFEIPNGAAGHYLLGLIYRHTGRLESAADQFEKALVADPLLWAAYEELCTLGVAKDANHSFNDEAAPHIQEQYLAHAVNMPSNSTNASEGVVSNARMMSLEVSLKQSKQMHAASVMDMTSQQHVMTTVAPLSGFASNFAQYDTPSPVAPQSSAMAPPPLIRNAQPYLNTIGCETSIRPNVNPTIQVPRRKQVAEANIRKLSGRLFSDSGTRKSTRLSKEATANANSKFSEAGGNGTNQSTTKFLGGCSSTNSSKSSSTLRSVTFRKGQVWSSENFDEVRRIESFDDSWPDNAASSSSLSTTSNAADNVCMEPERPFRASCQDSRLSFGICELLKLLRTLGEGFRLSCLFRSQEALDSYQNLPERHFNTGWVLVQVGKAHFETGNYIKADCFFERARRIAPYRIEGIDIYSTVLYHLRDKMKLSYLAQDLISIDRLSPQAWCAVGNYYSLLKDHETALKNFKRAVQLDSRFPYAHTLCGHEYTSLEEYESGVKSFQSALQVDERHYNSWYGLGVVYLRQERFELAEYHFQRAHDINPYSSVIMCYLGMSLHALKRSEAALKMMEKAITADSDNPLPVYQKALILSELERQEEALEVLERLKVCMPPEPSVLALMGRIYRRLDVQDKAMLCFGLALDLKPPPDDAAVIKAAMERLYMPDELQDC